MDRRRRVAIAFAAAAVLLGGAGAVAAANPIEAPADHAPTVTNGPGIAPSVPEAPDPPGRGDTPDGAGG
jgi:hypothetical protein